MVKADGKNLTIILGPIGAILWYDLSSQNLLYMFTVMVLVS